MFQSEANSPTSAFVTHPGPKALAGTLLLFGLAFGFSSLVSLPNMGYTDIGTTQVIYGAGSVITLVLAFWMFRFHPRDTRLLDGAILLAIGIAGFALIWTEYHWPDFGVGPFGFLLVLNCIAGVIVRRTRLFLPYMAAVNVAWLLVDHFTNGPVHAGPQPHRHRPAFGHGRDCHPFRGAFRQGHPG